MKIPPLDMIFPLPSLRQLAQKILTGPPGMVAVTGQTGTGKMTTLYSLAFESWKSGVSISLITEDEVPGGDFEVPQEWDIYRLDGSEASWHQAVERALENPCSGIITDLDDDFSLREGIEAARQNRWIFAAISTPFLGIDAFYHIQERVVTSEQILASFAGVVSQMLLPQLCRDCAEKIKVDMEESHLIYPNIDELKPIWQEIGCPHCQNRGTRGKCAAHEILALDSQVRPLLERYLVENIQTEFPSSNHIPLQTCLRELTKEGVIGLETYKWLVFRNPLLRIHHQKEAQEIAAREAQLRAQIAELHAQAVEQELQTAHDLQMNLMPKESPKVPGFDIAGKCLPANHVCGDFYQYFDRQGKWSIGLADITGHAMEAAIPAVMFDGILKTEIRNDHSLKNLYGNLNQTLSEILDRHTFVCFTMGELDPATRKIQLSNGGCPYPYHFRMTSGEVSEIQLDAYPLGVRSDTQYQVQELQLEPGDRIVFCSDGIIEAENQSGELFGFDRTAETVRKGCSQDLSAPQLLDYLISEVKSFTGGTPQGDDQTIVVLQVES